MLKEATGIILLRIMNWSELIQTIENPPKKPVNWIPGMADFFASRVFILFWWSITFMFFTEAGSLWLTFQLWDVIPRYIARVFWAIPLSLVTVSRSLCVPDYGKIALYLLIDMFRKNSSHKQINHILCVSRNQYEPIMLCLHKCIK